MAKLTVNIELAAAAVRLAGQLSRETELSRANKVIDERIAHYITASEFPMHYSAIDIALELKDIQKQIINGGVLKKKE